MPVSTVYTPPCHSEASEAIRATIICDSIHSTWDTTETWAWWPEEGKYSSRIVQGRYPDWRLPCRRWGFLWRLSPQRPHWLVAHEYNCGGNWRDVYFPLHSWGHNLHQAQPDAAASNGYLARWPEVVVSDEKEYTRFEKIAFVEIKAKTFCHCDENGLECFFCYVHYTRYYTRCITLQVTFKFDCSLLTRSRVT